MLKMLLAVMLSLPLLASAQNEEWTHIGQTQGNVMFVLGGSETHSDRQDVTLAVVPPPGRTHDGRPLSFFILYINVDCASWTQLAGSVHYFGPDRTSFDIGFSDDLQYDPIISGSATETAAEFKCRGRAASSPPILFGELAEAAARLRQPSGAPQATGPADFTREEGQDRPGADIGMVETGPRDYEACRAACAANTRCVAFTVYTPPPHEKGYCWLKHSAAERRAGEHVISGLRATTPASRAPAGRTVSPSPHADLCYAATYYFVARTEMEVNAGIADDSGHRLLARLQTEKNAWARSSSLSEQAAMDVLGQRSDAEVADIVNSCAGEPIIALSD